MLVFKNTETNLKLLFPVFKGTAWLNVHGLKGSNQKATVSVKQKKISSKITIPEAYLLFLKRRQYSLNTIKTETIGKSQRADHPM